MSQRPASEQFISTSEQPQSNPIATPPVDPKSPLARPISEIYAKKSSPEDEALEKWFEDLTQYERTLEEMAKASLEPSFKEELGAVENWFSALSEAERTAALYSLIHQATNVQVRFFITVLQKMTKDPINEALSPRPRSGLQYIPTTNRKKVGERHSMPIPNPDSTSFPTTVGNTRIANRLSIKEDFSKRISLSDIPEGNKTNWERGNGKLSARFSDSFKGKKIPSIDVSAASGWGSEEGSNGASRPKTATWNNNRQDTTEASRPRSASHNADPNWGSLREGSGSGTPKGRNPNNLTLKVDNVEIKIDSPHWPGSARNKPLKSPAVPPGLFSSGYSPISWAATPTDGNFVKSPAAPDSKSINLPSPVPEEGPKEPKPLDPVDFEMIESVPAWMRSLRLHKYTPIFEGLTWREVIKLTDEQLSEKGVAALGARRKFLKVFEHVKNQAKEKDIPLEQE
ncbi:hypothetical protein K502DRAFT_344318 [Neoconidiobolus thromboides FSU 785]|nr:hypothetical protein K502DRAFT_344318 [Neoconidiobolus thromboides FSU 785]